MKISVLMGIYNTRSKEILEQSINSILNQTFKDYEFIICDDGSTNNCLKWAKEICGEDKRVVFLENEKNMGLAYTLNKCLFLVGAFIIIYAILWILAELHLIPAIIFMIFPQLVLLAIGIFIVYMAYSRRNIY